MLRRGFGTAAGLLPVLAVIAPLTLSQPAAAIVGVTITPMILTDDASNTCLSDATCTLRGAVLKANNPTNNVSTIQLVAGTYTLTITNNPQLPDDGSSGDLDITRSYSIAGAGAGQTTVTAAPGLADRIFEAESSSAQSMITISDLKATGGNPTNDGSQGQEIDGGGILNDGQRLTLDNVILDGNQTNPARGRPGDGGGLFNDNGTVTVTHSTFSNNTAAGNGGGIANQPGNAGATSFSNLYLHDNASNGQAAADSGGGAIYDEVGTGSTAAFTDIMAIGNHAPNMNGGGVYENSLNTVTYDNMTLSANTAQNLGGGFYDGIGKVVITNSTITGNSVSNPGATQSGGGIAIGITPGDVTLNNDTVTSNTSPRNGGGLFVGRSESMHLHNTLVIDNKGAAGAVSNCLKSLGGTLDSTGHNMVNDTSCALGATGDQEASSVSPTLYSLATNQGPQDGAPSATIGTLTQGLPAGSTAINAADNTNCPGIDEQHVTRPQQGTCDVGAFEFVAAAAASPDATPKLPAAGSEGTPANPTPLVALLLAIALAGIPLAIRARRS